MITILMSAVMMVAIVEAKECTGGTGAERMRKCYKLNEDAVSWTKAVAMCRTAGTEGDLASVRDRTQRDAFQKAIGNSRAEFWIGASCENECKAGDTGSWYWISDGKNVEDDDTIRWAQGQPDNNCDTSPTKQCLHDCRESERVMVVKSNRAHDRGYWENHGYVCEFCSTTEAPGTHCVPAATT